MRILADSVAAAEFALGSVELALHSVNELSGDDLALWQCSRSTSQADPLFTGTTAPAAGGIRVVTIADEASGSQLDALTDWLRNGGSLPDGCAMVALSGERFHGQHNRAWVAHRGNLHLCVAYHPNAPAEALGAGLTMVPSLAVVDAIRRVAGNEPAPRIKWVNDVRIERKKVAGVLSTSQLSGEVVTSVVFGIGVNVQVAPVIEPTPFAPQVGCLATAYNRTFAVADILLPLLRAIDLRYSRLLSDGPDDLLRDYASRLDGIDRAVRILPPSEEQDLPVVTGILEGIYADLSLRISGQAEPVRAGRMVIAEESP